MRILLLGGTGSIGGAILPVLLERGHDVLALGRSAKSRDELRRAGATPLAGDLAEPGKWIAEVRNVEGIIQAAAVWGKDMHEVDRRFVDVLLKESKGGDTKKRFVYTGGCWMFGETGDGIATEDTPYDPLWSFESSLRTIERVTSAQNICGMVIHPGMVYERDGGVFDHIFNDARELGYVRVIGAENVRWPLVHRADLATLYALMIEKGRPGDVYNATAINGVTIGEITRTIARRLGVTEQPVVIDVAAAQREFGEWADGYALDQQLSSQKAMDELGWRPLHLDVLSDVT